MEAASFWEAAGALYDEYFSQEPSSEELGALIRLCKSGRTLEIGVGTGLVAIPLAEAGVDIVGVDISQRMLNQLAQKPGRAVPTFLMDAGKELPSGPFKSALCLHNTFYMLGDRESQYGCLRNLVRVLEDGGQIFIETFKPKLLDHRNVRGWADDNPRRWPEPCAVASIDDR